MKPEIPETVARNILLMRNKKLEVVTNCDHLAKLRFSPSLGFTADLAADKEKLK